MASNPRAVSGIERISTGIPELDEMLAGGLLPHRPYLVVGPPGSGKTTLAMQFLIEGIRRGEEVLYVTLEEPPNEVRLDHAAMGPEFEQIYVFDAVPDVMRYERTPFKDISSVREAVRFGSVPLTIRQTPEFESVDVTMTSLQPTIRQEVRRRHYKRLVIDSLTALQFFCMPGVDLTQGAQTFLRFLSDLGTTTLLTLEVPAAEEESEEHLLARGELRLFRWEADGRSQYAIGVEKFRGSSHDIHLHPYRISPRGLDINLSVTIPSGGVALPAQADAREVLGVPPEEVAYEIRRSVLNLDQDIRDLLEVGLDVKPMHDGVRFVLTALADHRYEDALMKLRETRSLADRMIDSYHVSAAAKPPTPPVVVPVATPPLPPPMPVEAPAAPVPDRVTPAPEPAPVPQVVPQQVVPERMPEVPVGVVPPPPPPPPPPEVLPLSEAPPPPVVPSVPSPEVAPTGPLPQGPSMVAPPLSTPPPPSAAPPAPPMTTPAEVPPPTPTALPAAPVAQPAPAPPTSQTLAHRFFRRAPKPSPPLAHATVRLKRSGTPEPPLPAAPEGPKPPAAEVHVDVPPPVVAKASPPTPPVAKRPSEPVPPLRPPPVIPVPPPTVPAGAAAETVARSPVPAAPPVPSPIPRESIPTGVTEGPSGPSPPQLVPAQPPALEGGKPKRRPAVTTARRRKPKIAEPSPAILPVANVIAPPPPEPEPAVTAQAPPPRRPPRRKRKAPPVTGADPGRMPTESPVANTPAPAGAAPAEESAPPVPPGPPAES